MIRNRMDHHTRREYIKRAIEKRNRQFAGEGIAELNLGEENEWGVQVDPFAGGFRDRGGSFQSPEVVAKGGGVQREAASPSARRRRINEKGKNKKGSR